MANVRQCPLDAAKDLGKILLSCADHDLLNPSGTWGCPRMRRYWLSSNFCAMSRLYQRMRVAGVAMTASSSRRLRTSSETGYGCERPNSILQKTRFQVTSEEDAIPLFGLLLNRPLHRSLLFLPAKWIEFKASYSQALRHIFFSVCRSL
jgi:hypothetical protein